MNDVRPGKYISTLAFFYQESTWVRLKNIAREVFRVLVTYSSNVRLGTHVNEKKESVRFYLEFSRLNSSYIFESDDNKLFYSDQ